MNELKLEDVVRALECCIKTQCENCCNLGLWHEQWNCMTDLMKKALALLRKYDSIFSFVNSLREHSSDDFLTCASEFCVVRDVFDKI